ncbi:hypothetical protein GQ472_06180 [archaeon]|nr:hypothetical protein [archaeon]
MADKIRTPKSTKTSQFINGQYHALRNRFADDPERLANFDYFMECQHRVFSSFFRLMMPYLGWLKYQYWLILFFFIVSVYYLFQPINIVWKLVTLYFMPFYVRRMLIYPIRDLVQRKDVGRIIIGIIFSVMMVFMWMPIQYYITLNIMDISHAVVGCDGIEDYYDPESHFVFDYYDMQSAYIRCYDSDEGSLFLAVPDDITGCKRDMDCEDLAYMTIRCLAPLYNMTCVPSIRTYAEYKVPAEGRKVSHVGVQCHPDSDTDNNAWFYLD